MAEPPPLGPAVNPAPRRRDPSDEPPEPRADAVRGPLALSLRNSPNDWPSPLPGSSARANTTNPGTPPFSTNKMRVGSSRPRPSNAASVSLPDAAGTGGGPDGAPILVLDM